MQARSAAPPAHAPEAAAPPQAGALPWLVVRGAQQNNLRNVTVGFPLGRFICVTGVSGSGKSSLVNDILHAALAAALNRAVTQPGTFQRIEVLPPGGTVRALRRGELAQIDPSVLEHLDKIIAIDQTPIGRTPRSNPATYIKVFDEIRDLFTRLPDAKLRGYKPGRFSFNVPAGTRGGGRCEACEGAGANRIGMDFLADVWVTCPVCEGRRFSRETRQVLFKGKSIADVLETDVADALELFDSQPRIRHMLSCLRDVGLDYLKLGQPSTTLSGGEAQRIKLARELVKKPTGRTVYVLDEPTTGLHFEDVRRLLAVLHSFVDAGNTVIVIEHNLDVIKTADWLIDMGPEGGAGGGHVLAEGPPEVVAQSTISHTGAALRELLAGTSPPDQVRAEPRGPDVAASGNVIRVLGARQHNLKDISVDVQRDALTVCTGVSGSGKTSFAIDTIFTEGYRRYVESLSAYARQFLGQMAKPRVDHVEGLSPAICIEQKAASRSPRSTVGTVTEIYDYMRVLWARLGTPYCPKCQTPVGTQTLDEIVDRVMALPHGTPILLLAPVRLGEGENYGSMFQRLRRSGYQRVRIDGEIQLVAQATTLDARRKHRVEVVVDRTIVRHPTPAIPAETNGHAAASAPASAERPARDSNRARISESIEHALSLGSGRMRVVLEPVETVDDPAASHPVAPAAGAEPESDRAAAAPPAVPQELLFSQQRVCLQCGSSYDELSPNHFSFNGPMGWCETCEGLGVQRGAPAGEIIRDPRRSLLEGALAGWSRIAPASPLGRLLQRVCEQIGVRADAPLHLWTTPQLNTLLFGASAAAEHGKPDAWIDAADVFDNGQAAPGRGKRGAGAAGVRVQWRGLFPAIDAAMRQSWTLRQRLSSLVTDIPCLSCRGGRVRPEAAAVRLQAHAAAGEPGVTIVEMCDRPLREVLDFFAALRLDERAQRIGGEVLHEIRQRLRFLIDVGLDYLTLHRSSPTLSGGEAQRIRLASQIGSGLSGVLYVLDEPTIGLHPRDTARLIAALHHLRELGNTLLLVEHDRDVIAAADHLLDFGPRAGSLGGEIVASAAPAALTRANGPTGERSLTRGYLSGRLTTPVPTNRRPVSRADAAVDRLKVEYDDEQPTEERIRRRKPAPSGKPAVEPARSAPAAAWLVIRGARQNNLRSVDVSIPLGRLVCVTGVSGSGKSSLVHDILWPALAQQLLHASATIGAHDRIEVIRDTGDIEPLARAARGRNAVLDKAINVDQSPIGATPASNPATYCGVFDWVRELYARLPESKVRGYQANRFSFNRAGGRCEACEGNGQKRIEMHFLPDVWVTCEECGGKRYTSETLAVRYKGKSIADVLDMRVAAALDLFDSVPKVRRLLKTLADVGLDYLQLGQPAPTLSGGEAQRVKLAAELGKPNTGRTIYLLDEPTTGLHFDDVHKLLDVLQRLVDLGNSVVVVEHNLDVLKSADWIIDLGPEAGAGGGQIVGVGAPEEFVAAAPHAHTARALAPVLAAGPHTERPVHDPRQHAQLELEVEKARLGDVGKGVRMPWQVDGQSWHLSQRPNRDGGVVRWESAALEYVESLVQRSGRFAPTNWSERASVEITARGAETWFLHALTGGQWLLELYFRAPPKLFTRSALDRQLGLKTLDQRDELAIYGSEPRVDVRARRDGLDAVVVYVHDKAEIDTPGFRRFVKEAASAYLRAVPQRP